MYIRTHHLIKFISIFFLIIAINGCSSLSDQIAESLSNMHLHKYYKEQGYSPLEIAINLADVDYAKKVIAAGENVNGYTKSHGNILYRSRYLDEAITYVSTHRQVFPGKVEKSKEIVKLLLDAGATSIYSDGINRVRIAKDEELFNYLVTMGYGDGRLFNAPVIYSEEGKAYQEKMQKNVAKAEKRKKLDKLKKLRSEPITKKTGVIDAKAIEPSEKTAPKKGYFYSHRFSGSSLLPVRLGKVSISVPGRAIVTRQYTNFVNYDLDEIKKWYTATDLRNTLNAGSIFSTSQDAKEVNVEAEVTWFENDTVKNSGLLPTFYNQLTINYRILDQAGKVLLASEYKVKHNPKFGWSRKKDLRAVFNLHARALESKIAKQSGLLLSIFVSNGYYNKAKELRGGKPWLGVNLEAVNEGIKINKLVQGGPAELFGIQAGDILTYIEGIGSLEGITTAKFLEKFHRLSTTNFSLVKFLRNYQQYQRKMVFTVGPDLPYLAGLPKKWTPNSSLSLKKAIEVAQLTRLLRADYKAGKDLLTSIRFYKKQEYFKSDLPKEINLAHMRIPLISATYSTRSRPPIPEDLGQFVGAKRRC